MPGQLLVLVASVVVSSSSVCWFLFWWCWRALGVLLLALVRLIARASEKYEDLAPFPPRKLEAVTRTGLTQTGSGPASKSFEKKVVCYLFLLVCLLVLLKCKCF